MLIASALLLPALATDLAPEPDSSLAAFLAPAAYQRVSSSKRPIAPKELQWKFVEVHAIAQDIDVLDDYLGGFGVRGAWEFDDGIFVRGGADLLEGDETGKRYNIGVGQTVSIREDASAFASLSWVWFDLDDAGNSNFSENGYRAEAGFRAVFDAHLGGEVRVGYEDVVDNGFLYGADLRYWFLRNVSLGLGYEYEVDDNIWTLGLRYAF